MALTAASRAATDVPVAPRPATIRDVARLAGVSRMTVTRALSDPGLVRPDTRDRVNQAIASLGYVPDRAAGSLSTRRTGFVGLLLPTLTNINFAMVAHGLTDVLHMRDFHLLITYNNYSNDAEEAQVRDLIARRPEAIVLTGTSHNRATNAMLMRVDVPVIEIADIAARPIQHAIGFSNRGAGRMAAQHLLQRGFRRIGAMGSLPQSDLVDHRGEARLQGFEEELRAHGASTNMILREGAAPVSYDHGAAAIGTMLARHPDVEAVFCISDLSAVGAMLECQRRGLDIPRDLSIMGFGDFDIGRMLHPPLSTIGVDFLDIGRRAGEQVLALLDSSDAAPVSIEVPLEMVARGSVRAIAAS